MSQVNSTVVVESKTSAGDRIGQRNVKTDMPIEDSRRIYAKARKFIVYDTFSL